MIIISIEIYFCDIVSDVEVRLLKLKETKEKKKKRNNNINENTSV